MSAHDEIVASVPDDIRPNQPTNILLPCIPGSTRLYDWSLNRSDSQADTREDLNKSGESESSTDECTPVKASLSLPQSRKLSSIFKRIFARNIRITGKKVLHNSSSSSTSVDNLTNTENNIDHVCKPTRWLSSPVLSNSKDNMKIMNFKSKIKFNRKRCKSREKDENSLKNISFQSSTDVKNATSTKIITRCDYVHKYAQTSETQCDHCVQLQAKILTYEAVNAAQKDFAKEKSIQEVISSSEAGIQCNETLQAVEVSTETHESQYMCNDDVSTQTDLEVSFAHCCL
ncbi:unnamed protein product [Trichobilharzia regenti]|nr:unnamed protein product [Trichobilharzia regenti]